MMLEMVLPACQIAIRIGFSSFVYQDEVMSVMPGKKGASVRPMKNRQMQKPTPLYKYQLRMKIFDTSKKGLT